MKYCQFNEDELLNFLPKTGFFVEIGCLPDYRFSNVRHLHEAGWEGIYIDMNPYEFYIHEKITPDNINSVLERYTKGKHIDLMSIDIDGNDYYVFENLKFLPDTLIIEYNIKKESGVMDRDDEYEWHGQSNFGASKASMVELAERKGYRLVAENESNLILRKNV